MAKWAPNGDFLPSISTSPALKTPALVYEEKPIVETLKRLARLKTNLGIQVLYSVKALAFPGILKMIAKYADGFSASSFFETKLSRDILGKSGSVHFISPAIVKAEIPQLRSHADYVSFNSLSQWHRFKDISWKNVKLGLRVNPGLSFVKDERYDPCRKSSKLGIPVNDLMREIGSAAKDFKKISGVHFHSNCEAQSLKPLLETTHHICKNIHTLPLDLDWINLGGGYLFDEIDDWEPLAKAMDLLRRKSPLKVFIEPGEAVVGRAGSLIATVLDIFESDGKKIAFLDSTINHFPQIFEYQYQLNVLESTAKGKFPYVLAGRSCLAGDLFGEYRFSKKLKVGDRITFTSAGAYSLVKSNMFNGINLPTLYLLTAEGELKKLRDFSYQDFWVRCGGKI